MNKRRIKAPEHPNNKQKNIRCYVVVITRYYNDGEVAVDRQQYYNENEALNDIKHLIMDLLEVQVHNLKLYNEEERIKTGYIQDFEKVFNYDILNRRLELKNSFYPISELIRYLNAEFFGYTIKHKIWEVITNNSKISEPYKKLEHERLTYKEIEERHGGHPLYRT
jgi:hypothetical protein